MDLIYDLRRDTVRVRQLQAASQGRPDVGLLPDPHLVGSWRWWRGIAKGSLPTVEVEGTVDRVFWGSMGDWPMFAIRSAAGELTEWTREGDVALYVPDQRVRLQYVVQRYKPGVAWMNDDNTSRLVIRIWLEPTDRRSDSVGPGPFIGAYDDIPAAAEGGGSWHSSRTRARVDVSRSRFFRRPWEEDRGDEFAEWGRAVYYFWVLDGQVEQQVERYVNGISIAYDRYWLHDHYGALSDQPLEPEDEWAAYEVDVDTYISETDVDPLNRR